jgi:hypothetical protein
MNQAGRFNLDTFRKKLNDTLLIHQCESRIPHIHDRHRLNGGISAGQPGIHPFGLDDDIGVKRLVRTGDFVKIRKIERDSYLGWTLIGCGTREIGRFCTVRRRCYRRSEQTGKQCAHTERTFMDRVGLAFNQKFISRLTWNTLPLPPTG